MSSQTFLHGLVLAGCADFKKELQKSDLLHQALQELRFLRLVLCKRTLYWYFFLQKGGGTVFSSLFIRDSMMPFSYSICFFGEQSPHYYIVFLS